MKGLEEARRELLEAQKKQGDVLGAISQITEMHTEKLAEEQQKKLSQQQMLLKASRKNCRSSGMSTRQNVSPEKSVTGELER